MYCQKCGKETPDSAPFCNNCGAPLNADVSNVNQASSIPTEPPKKKKKKGKGCLIAIIVVAVILIIGLVLLLSGDDNKSSVNNNFQTIYAQMDEKEFKSACKKIAYKDIARQPDNYIDELVEFTGEIIQIEESYPKNHYYARVNVTETEWGYEDTIYLTFELQDGDSKLLEDDIIKIYGVCNGEESYTSIFGEKITIPSVAGVYVELVK